MDIHNHKKSLETSNLSNVFFKPFYIFLAVSFRSSTSFSALYISLLPFSPCYLI